MNIILTLTPEEYNLVHKGLSKLTIEEGLPTLNKIIGQAQEQLTRKAEAVKELEDGRS